MGGAIVSGGAMPEEQPTYAPRHGSPEQLAPGWWRAADGLFYPPETHPNYAALQAVAAQEAQDADRHSIQAGRKVSSWSSVERFTVVRVAVGLVILLVVVAFRIVGLTSSDSSMPPISQPSPEEVREAIDRLNTMGTGNGGSGGSGGVYAETPVDADDGVVVFTDDFTDVDSGWPTIARADGRSAGYAPTGGYAIVAPGDDPVWASSPVEPGHVDLMISATGVATGPVPDEAAFGVSCGQAEPERAIGYQYSVEGDGHWTLTRRESAGGATDPVHETRLDQGNESAPVGEPTTIRLVCSRLGIDSTRLVAFLGDEQVADLIDSAVLPTRFWSTGLIAVGEGATATVSGYEQRDLGPR